MAEERLPPAGKTVSPFGPTNELVLARQRAEVEVFVHAHFCFRVSSNVDGIERTLALIRTRVPRYVRQNNFKLLVRLVTGTEQYGCVLRHTRLIARRYSRLEYCLDFLVKYEKLELILDKHMVASKDAKKELQRALFQFLLTNYPERTRELQIVLLHFGMFRYGTLLFVRRLNGTESTRMGSVRWLEESSPDSRRSAATCRPSFPVCWAP